MIVTTLQLNVPKYFWQTAIKIILKALEKMSSTEIQEK